MSRQFSRRTVKTQFTVVPDSIVNDKRLSLSDKGVAMMLWATPNGWVFHPEEFATRTSNGINAVKASLRRLEKAGYITRQKVRDEKGAIVGADYVLHEKPENNDDLTDENLTDENTSEAKCNGCKTMPNNNKDLIPIGILEQKEQNNGADALFADANARSDDDPLKGHVADLLFGFESFWEAYPKCERKVGKAKCREIWSRNRLHKVASAVMTALAIDAKSSDWTKDNGKFIPMPATWLNRKRYEDVQQPQEGASKAQDDTFAVLTYDDVSKGRSFEFDSWVASKVGKPPAWSVRSREWVSANRHEILNAEKISKPARSEEE